MQGLTAGNSQQGTQDELGIQWIMQDDDSTRLLQPLTALCLQNWGVGALVAVAKAEWRVRIRYRLNEDLLSPRPLHFLPFLFRHFLLTSVGRSPLGIERIWLLSGGHVTVVFEINLNKHSSSPNTKVRLKTVDDDCHLTILALRHLRLYHWPPRASFPKLLNVIARHLLKLLICTEDTKGKITKWRPFFLHSTVSMILLLMEGGTPFWAMQR